MDDGEFLYFRYLIESALRGKQNIQEQEPTNTMYLPRRKYQGKKDERERSPKDEDWLTGKEPLP